MPRGTISKDGDTRIAPNGYHYVKVDGQWRLRHHVVAEASLGRPIKGNEIVKFIDGCRTNFDPSNISVTVKKLSSVQSRLAKVNRHIRELQELRSELLTEERELKANKAKKV